MRRVFIDNLKGIELLAKPIYTEDDKILLSRGVVVKLSYIKKLKEMGIEYVFIDDDLSEDIEIKDFIEEKTRRMCKNEVKDIIIKYANTGKAEIGHIAALAGKVIEDVLATKEVVVNLEEIRQDSEANYDHSVAVCGLAVLTAIKCGFTPAKANDLAVGALLHDLGKAIIPESLLNKKEELTVEEFDIIKKHVIHGYEAVKDESWLSAISKVVILTHHERINGSGYPFGWTGEKTHDAAKIVAICDVFDAMTHIKPYRPAYKIYEVIEYLEAMKGSLFEEELVDIFIKHIAVYPSGSGVLLSDMRIGIVIRQNPGLPTRPIIRILKNEEGHEVKERPELDLSFKTTLFISEIIQL
jgi:HD-GYP domain-containing protein (c-di-GMP phosphodiesterase class II)